MRQDHRHLNHYPTRLAYRRRFDFENGAMGKVRGGAGRAIVASRGCQASPHIAGGMADFPNRFAEGTDMRSEVEEAITPRKQLKLVQLGDAFVAENPMFAEKAWRIDVVAIELDRAGKLIRLEVIKDAVQM